MVSPEFDIIFAGGGATACVAAGRLIERDPSLKILVVESGQHSCDVPQHVQPCRFVEHINPKSTTLTYFAGKPSVHLNGRSVVASSGRCVGGGSAVNFMLYVRGAASDYDNWAAFGNEGWSFDKLLPFIKKTETFPIAERTMTHGYSGPIKISACSTSLDIGNQFLRVAKEYDPERPQVDDNNDFVTSNAYGPTYRYIDPVNGRRSDAASTYLYPHAGNPNLTIMVGKQVKRVIFENRRAVGIEYVEDPISSSEGGDTSVIVRARKLVVISAGAFGSPAILERSGIGKRSVLEGNDIPVLVDLPGVGENYQDHIGVCWTIYGSNETETMDEVWKSPEGLASHLKEWEERGTGKIAHNGIEAMAKVRLTKAQVASAVPALQERWGTFFDRYPDKPMAVIQPFSGFPWPGPWTSVRKRFGVTCYILYPESTGHVHITSGQDVNSPLDFEAGILSKAGDVAQLTLLYKMSRELMRRIPAYRGEVAAENPQFSPDSPAACKETDDPVPIDALDIVYSTADDEAINNFVRDNALITWHSLGTCGMKPRELRGVVDARLSVYGVEGLKVADMSICPGNVGNNTYSTALLIGEKAAAVITEALGYPSS